MQMQRSLRSADAGAAAIQYAVIAGIVALGIVGSLTSTKSSLNATFGSVSSQMASATPDPYGMSPMAKYWSSKGLVSTVKTPVTNQYGSFTNYTFNFADGSQVTAVYQATNYWSVQYSAMDAATNQAHYEYYDYGGNLNYFQVSNRYPDGRNSDVTRMYTGDYQPITGDPPQGTTVIRNVFDSFGSVTGTYASAVPAFYSQAAKAAEESAYFASLMK